MAYDEKKDEVLYIRVEEFSEANHLEVKLVRYDKGEPRIQIARFSLKSHEEGAKYRRLGRMTLNEACWATRAIEEIITLHRKDVVDGEEHSEDHVGEAATADAE